MIPGRRAAGGPWPGAHGRLVEGTRQEGAMSSVFAFVRAGVMLGCLVAAPVLAITHGGAMECARKAVVRLWDRGPRELDPGHENESVAREQLPGRMQAGA